jgi:hypothetical protein
LIQVYGNDLLRRAVVVDFEIGGGQVRDGLTGRIDGYCAQVHVAGWWLCLERESGA